MPPQRSPWPWSNQTNKSLAAFCFQALLVATLVPLILADSGGTPSINVDPKNDPRNPLKYITNNTLTTIGLVLTAIVCITHIWLIIKTKAKYMLVIVIAEFCYAVGIAARYGLHYNPDSKNIYIFEYLFITLAPCGFIAAEYVILGRLVQSVDGDKHLLVRPSRVTKIFVASDVVTFLIQAGGGTMAVTNRTDIDKVHLGEHIFLLGLILQLISFTFFTFMLLHFVFRMRKYEPDTWTKDSDYGLPWHKDWRAFVGAVVASCVGVLVRSTYRTVELSEGNSGPLTTQEIYFWVLDFVPLLFAISLYIPFWPGWFIGRESVYGIKHNTFGSESQATIVGINNGSSQNIPLYAKGGYVSQTQL